MSERLTADGWEPDVDPWGKLVKGKPFVYLDRAQAIADERDDLKQKLDDLQKSLSFEAIARLRKERNALRAELDVAKIEANRMTRIASEWREDCEMARKELDAERQARKEAEARAERLRAAGDALVDCYEILGDCPGPVLTDAIQSWRKMALADEPQPPKSAPDEDGDCKRCGLPWPDERETLEPHECPPGFTQPDEPDPAPTALDPALREPLAEDEPRLAYIEVANARIAALVAEIDRLQALLSIEQSKCGMAKEIIDGEPERTQAAIAEEADAWRAMLADPTKARLASCHRGREVTMAMSRAVAAKLREHSERIAEEEIGVSDWNTDKGNGYRRALREVAEALAMEADELAPPMTAQGQEEKR